jgi:hypothetical protein
LQQVLDSGDLLPTPNEWCELDRQIGSLRQRISNQLHFGIPSPSTEGADAPLKRVNLKDVYQRLLLAEIHSEKRKGNLLRYVFGRSFRDAPCEKVTQEK